MTLISLCLDCFQPFQQIVALGYRALRIDVRVPNDALRIDEENGARVHAAFFVEDAVSFADRPMRPIVGEQREGQAAELLRPGLHARNRIGAQLQDFHIECFELCVVLTEPADLILSPAGKSERQKRDHRAAAAIAGEAECLS